MTVTVGYVGLDHHHARPYLDTLAALPVDVTCVCSPSETAASVQIPGGDQQNLYADPTAMFDAENVDVAWLTLSNRDMPAVIAAAVERNIDVFAEKPAAMTAADLEPVAHAAATADVTVGIAYAWRSHPIAQQLRDRASAGFFGEQYTFETRFLASALPYRDINHYLYDQAASRGGILQWLGVHWLDLIPWIVDDPITAVNAQLVPAAEDRVDVETAAILQLRMRSGAIGTLSCGYQLRADQYDTSVRITGDEGRAVWDPIGETFGFDGETTLELESMAADWASTPQRSMTYTYEPTEGYGGHWGRDFVEQFFDARNGTAPVPAGLADALRVLHVLDAAYESARAGEWITVSS